jgi:hypothetical protein
LKILHRRIENSSEDIDYADFCTERRRLESGVENYSPRREAIKCVTVTVLKISIFVI